MESPKPQFYDLDAQIRPRHNADELVVRHHHRMGNSQSSYIPRQDDMHKWNEM